MNYPILLLLATAAISGTAPGAGPTRKIASASENEVREKSRQYDMGCAESSDLKLERIPVKFRYSYEKPTDPEHDASYFFVSCACGAYNECGMIFFDDPFIGLQPKPFAQPNLDKKQKIIGWSAGLVAGALSYQEKTKSVTSYSKGRESGDLSVKAEYLLDRGQTVLTKFEIDDSPNGKVDPKVVFKANR